MYINYYISVLNLFDLGILFSRILSLFYFYFWNFYFDVLIFSSIFLQYAIHKRKRR